MHHQEVSAPFPHPEHKCSTGTQSPSSGSRQWSTSEPSAFLFHSQGKPPSPSYLIHVEFSLFPDTSCILTFYSCKSNLHGEGEQCLSQVCSHWTALCCFHPSTELCVLLTGFPNTSLSRYPCSLPFQPSLLFITIQETSTAISLQHQGQEKHFTELCDLQKLLGSQLT